MAHPPYGKAVADYPRIPDTQGQAADGCYDFHAVALNLAAQVGGAVLSAHHAQSTWPRLPQPNWEPVAAHYHHCVQGNH